MDRPDDVGPGQREQVVVAFLVVRLATATGAVGMAFGGEQGVVALREAFAAVIGFLQVVALDHRAHRAIDDEDALCKRVFQRGDPGGVEPGQGFGGAAGGGVRG